MFAIVLAVFGLAAYGCRSADLPAWHQTVVFGDRSAPPHQGATLDTPIDLRPTAAADGRWVLTTPVIQTATRPGFSEVLVSWNIQLEPGAAAAIDLLVDDLGPNDWSRPLRIGTAGDASLLEPGQVEITNGSPAQGFIDTDYFRSTVSFGGAQVRVTLVGAEGHPPGRIERLAVCMSCTLVKRRTTPSEMTHTVATIKARNEVPFRSRKTDNPALAGRLCSPTSLAMVLAFHGVDRPVGEVAAVVRDPAHDIYGNWPRNIQGAFELGVPGFLTRFNEWESVAEHLQRGEPIIASIRAPRGVLRNAPYTELDSGHLIVLTGLDGRGGVFVNDPAAGTPERGQLVYSMNDLTTAWMQLGSGTAYVLTAPEAGR